MQEQSSSSGLKTLQLNDQKAGMQGLDKEVINKIIYEASKGTSYFTFQEKRQTTIDSKVKEMKSILEKVAEADRNHSLEKMNALGASFESQRNLSHSIVHIDMDAFYAAVEMELNPTLKGKPVAVGTLSMLSTSNYEARKYGVRAAMPGFIAKKLCPHLTIVPCNFEDYRRVSHVVRKVIEEYDPDYCPASLDEMYLDLTPHIAHLYKQRLRENGCDHQTNEDCEWCSQPIPVLQRDEMAVDIVQEIRGRIFDATNLTCSAGIAPNIMLAKVCSDYNKPNGQFQVKSTIEAVKDFISTLPVKKISGIGPVQGQILNAMGVVTCSDMWEKRDVLDILFSDTSSDFYLRAALGIGSTTVKSTYVRKSIGSERTFRELHDRADLQSKCRELCSEVVEDMQSRQLTGKVVVLKFKTTSFETHTRNHSLPLHSSDVEVIYGAAKRMLDAEIANVSPKPLNLRLMGIRMANLINAVASSTSIKDFLRPKPPPDAHLVEEEQQPHSATREEQDDAQPHCPICGVAQRGDLDAVNAHVDECLNRSAIREMLVEDLATRKRKHQSEDRPKVKQKMLRITGRKIEDYFR